MNVRYSLEVTGSQATSIDTRGCMSASNDQVYDCRSVLIVAAATRNCCGTTPVTHPKRALVLQFGGH